MSDEKWEYALDGFDLRDFDCADIEASITHLRKAILEGEDARIAQLISQLGALIEERKAILSNPNRLFLAFHSGSHNCYLHDHRILCLCP